MTWQSGHTGGRQQDDEWQSSWWQCCVCTSWTLTRKGKCRGCGISKKWGSQSASMVVQSQMASSNVAAGEDAQQRVEDATTEMSHSTSPHHQASTTLPSRSAKDASEAIKQLEIALKAVPAGACFDDTRQSITASICEQKKFITQQKPLGSQLESCRAAV